MTELTIHVRVVDDPGEPCFVLTRATDELLAALNDSGPVAREGGAVGGGNGRLE